MPMKSSVIICFYNRLDLLKCCLRSLSFNFPDFSEVVIADDGSDEAVVAELEKIIPEFPFPIIHARQERDGPRRAACRNNGIRNASGDYLIFLDADFAALPGAIRAHTQKARPGQFLAGRVKYLSEEQTKPLLQDNWGPDLLEKLYETIPGRSISREHREFLGYEFLKRAGFSVEKKQTFGGHFSICRKDIEAVNGYDENFVGWGGEDIDMSLRLSKAGLRGWSVIRTARVLHLWHEKEMGGRHWKEGPNFNYFTRDNIEVFCENGLVKKSDRK